VTIAGGDYTIQIFNRKNIVGRVVNFHALFMAKINNRLSAIAKMICWINTIKFYLRRII